MPIGKAPILCLVVAAAGAVVSPASAQLKPDQVLVIYDTRIPDSVAVAEYYAGSAKVPGGVGNLPGVRPGVWAYDLALSGAGPCNVQFAWIERPAFRPRLRDPIRAYLAASNLTNQIRCIVLTKGIPHLMGDVNSWSVGDHPADASVMWQAGNYTACSADSELVMLWQDLDATEANGAADSKADGAILNPYWQKTLPIDAWSTRNIANTKTFSTPTTSPPTNPGQYWSALPGNSFTPPSPVQTMPGDIYLVCRLDGNTVADVKSMIDRAQGLVIDTATGTIVLDESGSNGVPDPVANSEFDNVGADVVRAGDDYEQTRDAFAADGRFRRLPANSPPAVVYDSASNVAGFTVGPRIAYNGEGRLVSTPVVMLAHYGANSAGTQPGQSVGVVPTAGSSYAQSFNYAPGAVFNSMESFNGKQFGGATAIFGQQQASDFLSAGGTFAIAHAWEPFANHVPDNLWIARNFMLGALSWGEAAWSSIPVLSWQHIVVGDPLARVTRTSDDRNADGRISVEDLYAYHAAPFDVNNSGAPDNNDRNFVEAAARAGERTNIKGSQRP